MRKAGTPLLVTDGLAAKLPASAAESENLLVLKVNGEPRSLLDLTRQDLKPIRDKLLAPFGIRFDAPNKVALYLIGDDTIVVENFNDETVTATLALSRPVKPSKALVLPVDGRAELSCESGRIDFKEITSRTLVALSY